MDKKIWSIFLMILLIPKSVHGIGVMQENSYIKTVGGKTVKFVVLVWNEVNESLPIEMRLREAPEEFFVYIIPEKLILNFSKATFPTEKNAEYISTPYGLMKLTPVDILVNVPPSASSGNHTVLIDMLVGRSSVGISAFMEKTLKFTVEVLPLLEEKKPVQVTEKETNEKDTTSTTNETENFGASSGSLVNELLRTISDPHTLFLLLSFILILLISFFVYKYA